MVRDMRRTQLGSPKFVAKLHPLLWLVIFPLTPRSHSCFPDQGTIWHGGEPTSRYLSQPWSLGTNFIVEVGNTGTRWMFRGLDIKVENWSYYIQLISHNPNLLFYMYFENPVTDRDPFMSYFFPLPKNWTNYKDSESKRWIFYFRSNIYHAPTEEKTKPSQTPKQPQCNGSTGGHTGTRLRNWGNTTSTEVRLHPQDYHRPSPNTLLVYSLRISYS